MPHVNQDGLQAHDLRRCIDSLEESNYLHEIHLIPTEALFPLISATKPNYPLHIVKDKSFHMYTTSVEVVINVMIFMLKKKKKTLNITFLH